MIISFYTDCTSGQEECFIEESKSINLFTGYKSFEIINIKNSSIPTVSVLTILILLMELQKLSMIPLLVSSELVEVENTMKM